MKKLRVLDSIFIRFLKLDDDLSYFRCSLSNCCCCCCYYLMKSTEKLIFSGESILLKAHLTVVDVEFTSETSKKNLAMIASQQPNDCYQC